MTAAFTALADRLIGKNGVAATLLLRAAGAVYDVTIGDMVLSGVKASETEITSLTAAASGKTLTAGSGSFVDLGFATGQRIKIVRDDGILTNRGPLTVANVTATVITVTETLQDLASAAGFWVYATSAAQGEQVARVLLTDPSGFPGKRFADGSLLMQGHTGLLIAAKGITGTPAAGDQVRLANGTLYTIIDITAVQPAAAPIMWTALAKEAP